MNLGFETTAAVPKRLRAVEEQPVQQAMQGERKIRQAPSTDQKRVRRAMQRKTAANFSAGTCRMCEGNLIPMGRKSDSPGTMKAQCADCGAKHELQGGEVKKIADLHHYASVLTEEQFAHLQVIAGNFYVSDAKCPHCGNGDPGYQMGQMHGGGAGQMYSKVNCRNCDNDYKHVWRDGGEDVSRNEKIIPNDDDNDLNKSRGGDYARTASLGGVDSFLLRFAAMTWVPVVDTTPYLSAPSMSAIARRAQSVLDTEEIL